MHPLMLKVLQLREAGRVERVHCIPSHGSYSVASHTCQMLLLLEALHPAPTLDLYRAILLHDVPERWIGDSPAIAKQLIPGLRATLNEAEHKVFDIIGIRNQGISQSEHDWLWALDNLEFLLWIGDQASMGVDMRTKWEEMSEYITKNWDRFPPECQTLLSNWKYGRTSDLLGITRPVKTEPRRSGLRRLVRFFRRRK